MADEAATPSEPSQSETPRRRGRPPKEQADASPDAGDILMQLDRRGFASMEDALRYIKRNDDAVKLSRYEQKQLQEKKREHGDWEARLLAREEQLKVYGEKVLADKAQLSLQLEELKKLRNSLSPS